MRLGYLSSKKSFYFNVLRIFLLLCMVVSWGSAKAAFSSSTMEPATGVASGSIKAAYHVSDHASVTFYLPSGNLTGLPAVVYNSSTSTPICPTESESSTPTTSITNGGSVYDSTLTAQATYAGYTCYIALDRYSSQSSSQFFSQTGIGATGAPCPASTFPNEAAAGLYCTSGTLASLNNGLNANTSVCYSDFPSSPTCVGVPSGQSSPYNWVGVYYEFNSVVANQTTLTAGSKSIPVPKCGSGSLLILALTNPSATFTFNYTRSLTFEQSYDGYQGSQGACTCNSHNSITGNSPTNISCNSAGVTIVSGAKNAVSVNQITPATNFLFDGPSNPFTWVSGQVCTIGTVGQTTPYSP